MYIYDWNNNIDLRSNRNLLSGMEDPDPGRVEPALSTPIGEIVTSILYITFITNMVKYYKKVIIKYILYNMVSSVWAGAPNIDRSDTCN